MPASVNVTFVGDASQLEAASAQAANAVHAATDRIDQQFASVTADSEDFSASLGRIAAVANDHVVTVTGGLDLLGTATAMVASGFDAMMLPIVSDRLAALSGRIEEVNGYVKILGAGTQFVTDHFAVADQAANDYASGIDRVSAAADTAGEAEAEMARAQDDLSGAIDRSDLDGVAEAFTTADRTAGDYAREVDQVTAATVGATDADRTLTQAQTELATATAQSETNWAAWVAVALGTVALVGVAYLTVEAVGAVAGAIGDAASAAADYAAEISGLTALQQRLGDEARASAAALADLSRELGVSAGSLAELAAVAEDYQVSSAQAESVMRRLVEVIEDQSDKTKAAREVLAAYGVSLHDLTREDWGSLLDSFAAALDRTADSTQKTRDAVAVLGSDGAQWLKGIADGAAEVSHAMTEADRVNALVAARIADSQKKIEDGPKGTAWYDFWSGPLERLDQMITRTDTFKAKQEYALSSVAIAWREYQADVASLSDVWEGLKQSATDYFDLVRGNLAVPVAPADPRPASPVPTAAQLAEVRNRPPVEDQSLQAFEAELEAKKRLQENWLTWNRQREITFWKEARARYLAEADQVSPEEMAGNKVVQGIDTRITDLGRTDAQEQARAATSGARGSTAGDGMVERWKNELDQMKAEQGRWFAWSCDEEIAYWQDRLGQVAAGSKEYTRIEKEILTLKRENAREASEADLGDLRARQEAERGNAAAQLQIARTLAERIAETYGERSQRHRQALQEMERAERAYAEEVRRVNDVAREGRVQAAADSYADARDELSFRRQMGDLSAVEEIQQLRALEIQKHQIEQQARQERLQGIKTDTVARAQALQQIEAAERQHANRVRQIDRQEAQARAASIKAWTAPITASTNEMVNGILHGTLKADQVVSTFLTGLVGKYVQKLGEIAMEWISTHVLMAAWAWITGEEEAAATTASAIEAVTATKVQAVSEITSAAGVGAAWAMASVAAIPFVGWAMAPGVGQAHYAMAMSYLASAAVPAAEKGWWEVPNDTLAVIHKKEMVMPAPLADGVRRMVEGDGGGRSGDTHYHVNLGGVVAGRGVTKAELAEHGSYLAELFLREIRNGNGAALAAITSKRR